MVEVSHSGVQIQELLSALPSPESLLGSLLSPCGSVVLLNDVVATCRPDHLLVVNVDQAGDLSDRGGVASELIGMDDLWDIIFTEQPRQEGFRGFGVPMPLKEDIEHEPVLIHGPPKPVPDTVHARTHLVEMPAGTPTGFPLTQVFREEGSEFDAPLAERFMANLNAALVQQFLNIAVTQGETVVQPNGVLDDRHGKSVAVRLGVGHGGLAYLEPVKATQPFQQGCLKYGSWVRCKVSQPGGTGILERLNRTYKYQFAFLQDWQSMSDIRAAMPDFHRWDNYERRHSALGYATPWSTLTSSANARNVA